MPSSRSRLLPLVSLALCAAALWLYFTPYLALRRIQAVAEAGDAAALREHVDFPALRASLKDEVRGTVARRIGGDARNPLALLGGAVAGAVADPLVDAAVTPQGIAALARGGEPGAADGAASRRLRAPDLKVSRRYEGVSRFVVRFSDRESGEERVALVLRREGLAGWRLAGVRLGGDRP